MNFDFVSPQHLLFGAGRLEGLGELASGLGKRAFVVLGARRFREDGTLERVERILDTAGVKPHVLGGIHREPRVSDVDDATRRLREAVRDGAMDGALVVGLGGGAALDLGKAVAALAAQPHIETVRDALEGVGRGLRIEHTPLPFLAIPTTAGTGSEATKNAVVSSDAPQDGEPAPGAPFKKSLRHDDMVARAVLIDPELTVSLPPDVTARTGMDALTQLVESKLSCRATPLTRHLADLGIDLVAEHLVTAVHDGENLEAREGMALAAYLSGLCLANAGLGVAHGLAAALGIHCGVPHGLACAVALPLALELNRSVRTREIAAVSRKLRPSAHGSDDEVAAEAPEAIRELLAHLELPTYLSQLEIDPELVPQLVASSHGNSRRGNPREVSDEELCELIYSELEDPAR